MPTLRGHWKLRQVSADTSELEYQVQADPGGALPKWLVNWVNRKLPFHTIKNLRKQVKRPGYGAFESEILTAFDWSGMDIGGSVAPTTTTSSQSATPTS
jgi:hypothetical protein